MFFQLLYIHLYRPFLKYTRTTSPLPAHVSPRKYCTQGAAAVSKLFRLYKRTHGLRQICNIAIYIVHSACTIHLLNLPDKTARRDIIHGIKHLEEMGECWTAARRTLRVLHLCATRWNIEMPEEAEMVFTRVRVKWGVAEGGAPSPVSPQSLANMAKQITSQPLTDLMARNIQAQQQSVPHPSTIVQLQTGLSAPMAPSPSETIDTRRSSGGLSLPPQSAADLSRDAHRVRASTYLTKAQQDAWNAHQARIAASSAAASGSSSTAPTDSQDAAKLFGGIDSLIEETQDWFFKDQNQLAVGFENWGGDSQSSGPDWGTLDLSFFDTPPPEGASSGSGMGNTNGNSPTYGNGGMQYDYTRGPAGGVSGASGIGNEGGGAYVPYVGGTNGYANKSTDMNGRSGMSMRGTSAMGTGMGNLRRIGSWTGRNGLKRSQRSQHVGFLDDEVYY